MEPGDLAQKHIIAPCAICASTGAIPGTQRCSSMQLAAAEARIADTVLRCSAFLKRERGGTKRPAGLANGEMWRRKEEGSASNPSPMSPRCPALSFPRREDGRAGRLQEKKMSEEPWSKMCVLSDAARSTRSGTETQDRLLSLNSLTPDEL